MTQDQLADLTKIRRTTVNAYCTNKRRLGATNAAKIIDALGPSAAGLLPVQEPNDDIEVLKASIAMLTDRVEKAEREAAESHEEMLKLRQEMAKALNSSRQPPEMPKHGSRQRRDASA